MLLNVWPRCVVKGAVRGVLLKVGLGVLLEVVLGGVWFGRASLVWRDCLDWRDWWDVGNG